MSEICWAWNDASFVSRQLAKASPFHWSSSRRALDVIAELEHQTLKEQRRPVCLMCRGQKFSFPDVKQAIAFLRPLADHDRVTASKQQQKGGVLPEKLSSGTVRCKHHHAITERSEHRRKWFWDKLSCNVCSTSLPQDAAYYHCKEGCNYAVCHNCYTSTVWSASQRFSDLSVRPTSPNSDASTSAGPSTAGSVAGGSRIELQVDIMGRKEHCTFDMRPLDSQLNELAESFGCSSSSSSRPSYFLIRNCGADVEVLLSEAHLQSLVPLTLVSMEKSDSLVSRCLERLKQVDDQEVSSALRNLLALVCSSEVFADEASQQGAFNSLLDIIRLGGATVDLACAGICAILGRADRHLEAMTSMRDIWQEAGDDVLYNLFAQLFPIDGGSSSAGSCPSNATLTLVLWLLEDVVGATATAHSVSQGKSSATALPMYPLLVNAAQGLCGDDFQMHAGRLVLCTMLRTAGHQVALPDLLQDIRSQIETTASTKGILSFLEELALDNGVTEMLAVLTRCAANPVALELELRQQEVAQLRDEKKFSAMLQGKLRQNHQALIEMLPFLRLGDKSIEDAFASIIRHGWSSVNATDGYSLLHHLCEYKYDTQIIRLVAGLCPDLEKRDERGNRPIDYALLNSHHAAARCLVSAAQERVATGLSSKLAQSPHTELDADGASTTCDDAYSICSKPHTPMKVSFASPEKSFRMFETHRAGLGSPLHSHFLAEHHMDEHGTESFDFRHHEEKFHEDLPKGVPTPNPANVGTVFELKTQLSTAHRENKELRDKVGELEMLRTRLAILTDENVSLRDSSSPKSSVSGWHQRLLTASSEVSAILEDGVDSEDTTAPTDTEVPELAECPAKEIPTKSKGKGKAKGKGKGKGSVPPADVGATDVEGSLIAADASQQAIAEPAPEPATDQDEKSEQKSEEAAPKGKGKSKGKAKGGPAEPPANGKGKGKAKGEAKGSAASASPEAPEKGKGKGKGKLREPTKPALAPSRELKSVPWTRFVVGAQIEEGTTIWDEVNKIFDSDRHMDLVPVDEIEERFSKAVVEAPKAEKVEKKEGKKARTVKLDSISQEQRFQIEVSLRTLPLSVNTGSKAVVAIKELNKHLLSAEAVSTLHRFLCPSPCQELELGAKRQMHDKQAEESEAAGTTIEPFVWDPVEQYMEDLSQISACSMRLSCWGFLYNLPERVNHLQDNLDRFEQMVHCFRTSQELTSLLGLVLAFGNYLNGGKNEKRLGQADGFHIEMLGRPGGLDVVNDPKGRNVRELIFKVFFSQFPDKAERLLLELSPLFSIVQRRLVKDSDGVPDLKKSVRVQIEELDKQLMQLKRDFSAKHTELQEGLQLINDPADKFVVEIPEEFEWERKRVDELAERKDLVLQQFKALLAMYKAETYRGDAVLENGRMKDGNPKEPMTSEIWCTIWDDFFVVRSILLGFDEKKQKELEPLFCKDALLTVKSLKMMWRLEEPKQEPKVRGRRASTSDVPFRSIENRRSSI